MVGSLCFPTPIDPQWLLMLWWPPLVWGRTTLRGLWITSRPLKKPSGRKTYSICSKCTPVTSKLQSLCPAWTKTSFIKPWKGLDSGGLRKASIYYNKTASFWGARAQWKFRSHLKKFTKKFNPSLSSTTTKIKQSNWLKGPHFWLANSQLLTRKVGWQQVPIRQPRKGWWNRSPWSQVDYYYTYSLHFIEDNS